MNWSTSDRLNRLPTDWKGIRKRVLDRDRHECQAFKDNGRMCLAYANQVDHINPGDNHSEDNLQALCEHHHKIKSSGEGGRASAAAKLQRRKKSDKLRRQPETHPFDL